MTGVMSEGYGILPKKILKDKELSSTAKLLYVLISSLTAKTGYCYANNKYLGKEMGISEVQVSNTIKRLGKYLVIEDPKSHKRIINLKENFKEPQRKLKGSLKKTLRNHKENFKHNSISNNSIKEEEGNSPSLEEPTYVTDRTSIKESIGVLKAQLGEKAIQTADNYKPDHDPPNKHKKRRSRSELQLCYDYLLREGARLFKIEGWNPGPQRKAIRAIIDRYPDKSIEYFKKEIIDRANKMIEAGWVDVYDFSNLNIHWHKFGEQKVVGNTTELKTAEELLKN